MEKNKWEVGKSCRQEYSMSSMSLRSIRSFAAAESNVLGAIALSSPVSCENARLVCLMP